MSETISFKKCIGKNIKTARKAAGYTQKQLADMLGIEKGRISRLETGQTMVVAILLYYISAALDTPINDFFKGLPGAGEDSRAYDANANADMASAHGRTNPASAHNRPNPASVQSRTDQASADSLTNLISADSPSNPVSTLSRPVNMPKADLNYTADYELDLLIDRLSDQERLFLIDTLRRYIKMRKH